MNDDLGQLLSTYFMYDNNIENKSPTDLCVELYNMKQELDAMENERIIREYLKLAKLLRRIGQL
jgi:hypothetical protein